jgi:transposase InsO family protein
MLIRTLIWGSQSLSSCWANISVSPASPVLPAIFISNVKHVPKVTPDRGHSLNPESRDSSPFKDLKINFTELLQTRGYKCLLVIVCTFFGWVEAFPTWTEKAQEVVRTLQKEIIPRYGIPISIGSDNGPAFCGRSCETKGLKVTWKLHTVYRPQSSGKAERMNWTLKTQMSKLC